MDLVFVCLGSVKDGGAAFDKTLPAPGRVMTERSNCSSNVIIRNPNLRRRFETHKCPPPHPRLKKAIGILAYYGSKGALARPEPVTT